MDLISLKEMLTTGRETVTNLSSTLSNFLPFPAANIAGVLVLILSFLIVNSLVNLSSKPNFLTKILGTAAMFWVLWLW